MKKMIYILLCLFLSSSCSGGDSMRSYYPNNCIEGSRSLIEEPEKTKAIFCADSVIITYFSPVLGMSSFELKYTRDNNNIKGMYEKKESVHVIDEVYTYWEQEGFYDGKRPTLDSNTEQRIINAVSDIFITKRDSIYIDRKKNGIFSSESYPQIKVSIYKENKRENNYEVVFGSHVNGSKLKFTPRFISFMNDVESLCWWCFILDFKNGVHSESILYLE